MLRGDSESTHAGPEDISGAEKPHSLCACEIEYGIPWQAAYLIKAIGK